MGPEINGKMDFKTSHSNYRPVSVPSLRIGIGHAVCAVLDQLYKMLLYFPPSTTKNGPSSIAMEWLPFSGTTQIINECHRQSCLLAPLTEDPHATLPLARQSPQHAKPKQPPLAAQLSKNCPLLWDQALKQSVVDQLRGKGRGISY